MKPLFLLILLVASTLVSGQSTVVETGSHGFRLITEFKTANGFYQVIQNEKAAVLEINMRPRKALGIADYKNIYYYSSQSQQHVYSDDMKEHFRFDIFSKLDEIGGKTVKTWFHAPEKGPFIIEEIGGLVLDIGFINGIEKINGQRVEYDFVNGRPIRIGKETLDYIMGSRVTIQ